MSDIPKKKSLGGFLSNLLFEEPRSTTSPSYSSESSDESTNSTPSTPQPASTYSNEVVNTVMQSANITGIDEKFEKQIRDALRAADQPGPDYLEFSDAVRNLKETLNLDDDKAIQSAFAVLKSSGLSKEILLKTAQHYLSVLEMEETEFKNVVLHRTQAKIEGPQSEIVALRTDNEKIVQQIAELNNKLQVNNKQIEVKNAEILNETVNLETKKKKFHNTLVYIMDEIKGTVTKVEKITM